MDMGELKENKAILAALTGVLLVIVGAVLIAGDAPNQNPVEDSNNSDTPRNIDSPESPQDSSSADLNNTDEASTPSEGKGEENIRFSSVEKNYEVLEIDGVGDQVVVRASTGGREILELDGEVVANETVISEFRGVDGELYYVLERNGSKYAYNTGEPVSEGYSMIPYIRDIGGEPTFTVQESLLPSYIVRNGEKIGMDYYEAQWPAWVNGELAYKAIDGTQEFIVHGNEEQPRYDEIGYPIEAEGKLTYRAVEGNDEFIIHGEEKLESNYSNIDRVTHSEGKLTYIVNDGGELKLIREGKDLLKDNWNIRPDTMTWVGGKLAYIVTSGNEEFLIYDGERIGKEYNIQHSNGVIANVNGKIAFAAKQDDKWHIIREN